MRILVGIVIACAFLPAPVFADNQSVTTELAQVTAIQKQEERPVPGTDVPSVFQTLSATVLEGPNEGKTVTVLNDYLELTVGEKFYATHTVDPLEGIDQYEVFEPYRLPWVYGVLGLFALVVILLGGKQGVRGLVALALSFLFIGYLLLPGILGGYPPAAVALGVAGLIIVVGSYLTHGVNRVTTSAVVGMAATITATALLSWWVLSMMHFSGLTSEEAVYLKFDTAGAIDFPELLLGGILIGLLGVLYDAAIGQAVAVDELYAAAPDKSRLHIFSRAMRIGREHIGALVNTLAIAYAGAALPLLLFFYKLAPDSTIGAALNREIFSVEIVRIALSSIGLVLAVPLTTLVALILLSPKSPQK